MATLSPERRALVRDFSAGYLDEPESDTLPPGATPDALNAFAYSESRDGDRRCIFGKRPGDALLTSAAMSATGTRVDALFDYRRSAADPELVGCSDGKVYRFDNISAFAQIGATAPFTAGRRARAVQFRNNICLVDGTANRRYDGTALYPLGQMAPTGAPALAAVAGPGVTGTFRGYGVWYDPTMDHESSPSPISVDVVFANQQRQWGQPAGGPPAANYTQWRIYSQRVDTNELNYYRVTDGVLIATVTLTEAVSDTARRDAGAGPTSHANDVPPTFAIVSMFAGYGIGIPAESSDFYVTGLGDLQSVDPKNRFGVSRSDGDNLTTAKPYGEEFLLQKGHSTFKLVGDQLPFVIKQVHPKWGNVSHEASIEIDRLYYAWDREKGPYTTDLTNFTSLADGRIRAFLRGRLNRLALEQITAFHHESFGIVGWAVPTTGSSRTRTILAFSLTLQCWLPPMTGLEWSAFVSFTNPDSGETGVLAGDEWGRLFRMFSGNREGIDSAVDTAELSGDVTSATSDTLTKSGAAFPTTGAGLAGVPIFAKSPAGVWQVRRIQSNTADTVTLDTTNDAPWTYIPDATYLFIIGGIQWAWKTPWMDFGDPVTSKTWLRFYLQARTTSSEHQIGVNFRFNDDDGIVAPLAFTFTAGSLSGIWGIGIWGEALWASIGRRGQAQRVAQSAFTCQAEWMNYYPDQPAQITAYDLSADMIPERKLTASG